MAIKYGPQPGWLTIFTKNGKYSYFNSIEEFLFFWTGYRKKDIVTVVVHF